jgi:hypothetical protein
MKNLVGAGLATIAILAAAALLIWADSPVADELNPGSTPLASTANGIPVERPRPRYEIPSAPNKPDLADEFITPVPPLPDQLQLATAIELTEPTLDTALLEETRADTAPDYKLDDNERLTLKQTEPSDTSLRNADFPRTYISSIRAELTSPNHWVHLTWSGPQAAVQEKGPFRSSPGRGLGDNNCDDDDESQRNGSNCTPKGTLQVRGFSETMRTCSVCRFITWFQSERGIAFHYYPEVPGYPASHGCVRLEKMHAAQLIHNNSKIGATEVTIVGKWKFVR